MKEAPDKPPAPTKKAELGVYDNVSNGHKCTSTLDNACLYPADDHEEALGWCVEYDKSGSLQPPVSRLV